MGRGARRAAAGVVPRAGPGRRARPGAHRCRRARRAAAADAAGGARADAGARRPHLPGRGRTGALRRGRLRRLPRLRRARSGARLSVRARPRLHHVGARGPRRRPRGGRRRGHRDRHRAQHRRTTGRLRRPGLRGRRHRPGAHAAAAARRVREGAAGSGTVRARERADPAAGGVVLRRGRARLATGCRSRGDPRRGLVARHPSERTPRPLGDRARPLNQRPETGAHRRARIPHALDPPSPRSPIPSIRHPARREA
ncbi:hypothetical protein MICRO8M_60052 [Microbacterium sp. 8M]|nr:hypothetical protein MICRO8M_60052 [Microbacterium sp. 8M]